MQPNLPSLLNFSVFQSSLLMTRWHCFLRKEIDPMVAVVSHAAFCRGRYSWKEHVFAWWLQIVIHQVPYIAGNPWRYGLYLLLTLISKFSDGKKKMDFFMNKLHVEEVYKSQNFFFLAFTLMGTLASSHLEKFEIWIVSPSSQNPATHCAWRLHFPSLLLTNFWELFLQDRKGGGYKRNWNANFLFLRTFLVKINLKVPVA